MMNRFETSFSAGREAKLRYLDADFQVVQTGEFVRCAVTEQPIKLNELRYWSVERQEAYASAEAGMQRLLEVSGD